MSEFDERISKAYDLIERYGRSESDIHYETGLDADDCFRDLMVYVKGLVARIAELEAEIDQLTVHSDIERQDDKWIPVSERLPEKQKLTIGFTDNSAYVFFEIVNDDEMGLVMYPYQNRKGTVTHWMPLPSTPEVQE